MTKLTTVKREAKVGERILITNAKHSLGFYRNGDVFTVSRARRDDSVDIKEIPLCPYIRDSEYRVIVEESATGRRLTEAEAKIAALEAEVKALKDASKPPMNVTINASHVKDARDFAAGVAAEIRRGLITSKKTPNQRRADVIKRAQAFANEGYDRWFGDSLCYVEFFVNSDKRTVVAVLRGKYSSRLITKAIAKCAPDDVFNAGIGKAIALGRALGVKVPKEFTDAVKPTEVVVGTKIKYYATRSGEFSFDIQTDSESEARMNNADLNGDDPNYFVKIVDDTDAVYL